MTGFEPATTRSQSGCATKLRHTPYSPRRETSTGPERVTESNPHHQLSDDGSSVVRDLPICQKTAGRTDSRSARSYPIGPVRPNRCPYRPDLTVFSRPRRPGTFEREQDATHSRRRQTTRQRCIDTVGLGGKPCAQGRAGPSGDTGTRSGRAHRSAVTTTSGAQQFRSGRPTAVFPASGGWEMSDPLRRPIKEEQQIGNAYRPPTPSRPHRRSVRLSARPPWRFPLEPAAPALTAGPFV